MSIKKQLENKLKNQEMLEYASKSMRNFAVWRHEVELGHGGLLGLLSVAGNEHDEQLRAAVVKALEAVDKVIALCD